MDTWKTRVPFVRGHRPIKSSTRSFVRSMDKPPQSKQPFSLGSRSRILSSRPRHQFLLRPLQSSPPFPKPPSPPHGRKPPVRQSEHDQGSSRRVARASYSATTRHLWDGDGSSTSR